MPEGRGAWRRRLARIKKAQPSAIREAEAAKEAAERREKELREREREPPPVPELSAQVAACLADTSAAPDRKMRYLAGICFEPFAPPRPIRGRWEDLDGATQAAVITACQAGLEVTVPGTCADPRRFTLHMLAEGKAFAAVVRSPGGPQWLSALSVDRWLPVALAVPLGEFPEDIVRACWEVAAGITETVLREFVARELASSRSAAQLGVIPAECWTDGFAGFVAERLADDGVSPETRRWALDILAVRSPALALPIARQWATIPVSDQPEDQLRLGDLYALLRLEPATALGLLEAGYAARGSVAVAEATALWERGLGSESASTRWGVPEQGRLLPLLLRAYPLEQQGKGDDEDEEVVRPATDVDQLRWFRNGLVDALLRAKTPEANAILDARGRESDAVAHWVALAAARAADEARALLGTAFTPAGADPSAISLAPALRVLDSAAYRLIRSEDDLLDVVLDVLQTVEADVAADLPLLYGSPPRAVGPPGKCRRRRVVTARKHLHEDALQAYLRRRLCDLLPARAEGVQVEVLRENQVQYRRRLDLLVLAPCLGRRELAAVVIEVKWSDNDETDTSLREQLGRKYLKKERRTHGVYLVGWSGSWKQKGKKKTDRTALVRYLTTQRDQYCAAAGRGLRIEPVILGLTWRDPAEQ